MPVDSLLHATLESTIDTLPSTPLPFNADMNY
jgi:hypothetical protein